MRYVEKNIIPDGTVITANGLAPASGAIDTFDGDDAAGGALQRSSSSAVFYIDVAAMGGTAPTIQFFFLAPLGGKNYTIGQSAVISANGRSIVTVANAPRNMIVSYVVGGTTPTMQVSMWMTRN